MKQLFTLILFISIYIIFPQDLKAHLGVHDQIALLDGKLSKKETYSLYAQRANLNFEGGDYKNALHDLDEASKRGAKEPLFYQYARIYAAQNDYQKALQTYNEFIKFNPNIPQAYQERAKVYNELKQYEKSIKDYEKSFKLQNRPNPGYFIQAADILVNNIKNGKNKALGLLDKGIFQLRNQGVLQEKAIEIEISLGNFENAIKRMIFLGTEQKENPFWRVNYAKILQKANRNDECLKQLNLALKDANSRKQIPAIKELLITIKSIQNELNKKQI